MKILDNAILYAIAVVLTVVVAILLCIGAIHLENRHSHKRKMAEIEACGKQVIALKNAGIQNAQDWKCPTG